MTDAPALEPVYLLTGGDRPKIARAVERLKTRVGRDGVDTLSARDSSGSDAVAACNTMGLFAGAAAERLVLVTEVERWKAADAKAVAEYAAAPTPETILALVGDVKSDSPLGKAIAKTPALKKRRVLVYDLAKKRLPAWVAEQFARHGVKVDVDVARRLVELSGEDPDTLEREVEKIVTWARGEAVGEAEVELLAAPLPEAKSYEVSDAWGRRDRARALALAEALLEGDARPRRDAAAGLGAMLASHVRRVAKAKRLAEAGVSLDAARNELDYRWSWQARGAYEQADRFSVEELAAAVVRFAALDGALKGVSRLPPDLELERALVETTAASPSAGRG